ncbi:MAG: hypothetical protein E7678_07045 [Ruminococcaceae bacterium]|nr:hypothetical protein [Oscillospiraceae bacterium]
MEKQEVKKYYTIDVLHIVKFIWRKIWIVLLAAAIAAGAGFGLAAFIIKPTYSSTILLYVNNSSTIGGIDVSSSISLSDITASQSLVKTYGEILDNRTTLELVIDKAGVDYKPEELSKMIESGSSNDTEIMYVKVTANDPEEADKIADCISEVLPERIKVIIDGASMEVVDSSVPNYKKIGPSITKFTIIGFAIGTLISLIAVAVVAMMDDRIHDEDYIIETYDYPILAKIPDLVNTEGKKYSYYYESKSHSGSDAAKNK